MSYTVKTISEEPSLESSYYRLLNTNRRINPAIRTKNPSYFMSPACYTPIICMSRTLLTTHALADSAVRPATRGLPEHERPARPGSNGMHYFPARPIGGPNILLTLCTLNGKMQDATVFIAAACSVSGFGHVQRPALNPTTSKSRCCFRQTPEIRTEQNVR